METGPTWKQKRREKEKRKKKSKEEKGKEKKRVLEKEERYERLIVTNSYVELSLNVKALLSNMRKETK